MDPEQPAALWPLEGEEEAAEGGRGERRRQEREKKLEFPVDPLLDS